MSKKIPAKTRDAVYTRDKHRCVLAGVRHRFDPCMGDLTVQHTVGKGMGGSKLFDTPDLLVAMCWHHNVLIEQDADFARFCAARGLVRSRNSKRDPRLVPVLYVDGWHRLEGIVRVPVPAIDAVEYMRLIGAIREGMPR